MVVIGVQQMQGLVVESDAQDGRWHLLGQSDVPPQDDEGHRCAAQLPVESSGAL